MDKEVYNTEVEGAERAVEKMLIYYVSALQDAGVQDVRQYIASKICSMIQFSEAQVKFIKTNFTSEDKILDNLVNSVKLLENMEKTKELDLSSIKIIREVLNTIIEDYKREIE